MPCSPRRIVGDVCNASGVWWHASEHRFEVGDWIQPSSETGNRASWHRVDPGDQYDARYVYLIEATTHDNVRGRFSFSGPDRYLYRVEPVGECREDPDETMRWKDSWCFDRARVIAVVEPTLATPSATALFTYR